MMLNILFDLDGTLIDSRLGITKSYQYALEKLGLPTPTEEELLWTIGPPLAESMEKLLGTNQNHLLPDAIRLYRDRYGATGMFENTVYNGIEELLNYLKTDGHKLFVATAKPTVFAKPILAKRGLDIYFEEIFGSGLDGSFGKKGILIQHIIEYKKLNAKTTIMVGDREHDIHGANENNIKSIGVLWGYGNKYELKEAGAFSIASNTNELIELLS